MYAHRHGKHDLGKSAKTIHEIVQNEYNNRTKKGSGLMSITATELKNNLGKYLLLSATEDVFITKNGKIVAKLTNPHQDRVEVAKSLEVHKQRFFIPFLI